MNILFVYSTYSREITRNSVVADNDDDDDNSDDGEEEEETDTARISNKIVAQKNKRYPLRNSSRTKTNSIDRYNCTGIFKLNYFVKPAQGSTVVTQVLFSVKCVYKND